MHPHDRFDNDDDDVVLLLMNVKIIEAKEGFASSFFLLCFFCLHAVARGDDSR